MKKRFCWLAVLLILVCLLPLRVNAAGQLTVKRSNTAASGTVKLSWEAVDGAKNYRILRATSKNGTYQKIDTVSKLTYSDTSATVGKQYYYKVRALKANGNAIVTSAAVAGTRDLAQPKVTASNVASSGKIRLTWKAISGAAKYEVYRSASKNGTYTKLGSTTKTSYTNTGAQAGKMYYYKVKAIHSRSAANSAFSAIVSRTCDLARPDVTASNVASSGKIKLTWKAVDGASKYQIYRATAKNGTYSLMKTVTGTTYTNTSAVAGKLYYYKVKAIHTNTNANSVFSEIDSRTCALPRPEVTVTLNGSNKPRLSWKAIEGATKYEIYRSTAKNGTYSRLGSTAKLTYTNSGAQAGKTYFYKVKAIHSNTNANSAFSTVVSIATPYTGATVMTAEVDNQLHSQRSSRINAILNTPTSIVHSDTYIPGQTYTGTAYYVSNDGDDSNDGLTPETAWQTTGKLLQELGQREGHVVQPGDAVFLRRGDTFRLPYWALDLYADNLTLSAYGTGPKPIITASSENGTGAEKWELVYEDGTGKKIWKFYRDIRDTSMIVMNDGEVITDRVYEYWDGSRYLACTQDDWSMHSDQGVTLLGGQLSPEDALTEDMTILSRPVRGVPDENGCESGPLYLRCDRGNPGSLYASIEFSELEMCALLWIDGCNVTVDNISFRCNGNAYLKLSGAENGAPLAHHDYMIQNCEFAYGGGCVSFYTESNGQYYIWPQGDGIYSLIQNTTIRNNYFHETLGATATYENDVNDPRTAYGYYRVLDNVIVNTMGIHLDCTSESLMHLDSVVIRGNHIWNTGHMDRGMYYYSEGSIGMMHSQYGELIIEDNILYGTENGHPMNALLQLFLYDFTSRDRTQPQFRNNIYAQYTGRNFADFLDEEEKFWSIDDPDLLTKYAEKLHDTTSQFYVIK